MMEHIMSIIILLLLAIIVMTLLFTNCTTADMILVGIIIFLVGLGIMLVCQSMPLKMATKTGGATESKSSYTKMELMDPKHNFREIAKQMILLEDHLAHSHKRCVDCITKHFLMIEALYEEATTLDTSGEYRDYVRNSLSIVKPPMMDLIKKIKTEKGPVSDEVYGKVQAILRKVRKELASRFVLNN